MTYEEAKQIALSMPEVASRGPQYVEDFIQIVPIEYKRVLEEEKVARLQQKIADVQRDY